MSCGVTSLSVENCSTGVLQCETIKIAKENRDHHKDTIVIFRSEEKYAWTHRRVIRFSLRSRHSASSFRHGVSQIPELGLENSSRLRRRLRPKRNSAMLAKCIFSPVSVRLLPCTSCGTARMA